MFSGVSDGAANCAERFVCEDVADGAASLEKLVKVGVAPKGAVKWAGT